MHWLYEIGTINKDVVVQMFVEALNSNKTTPNQLKWLFDIAGVIYNGIIQKRFYDVCIRKRLPMVKLLYKIGDIKDEILQKAFETGCK